jgi:hypothetical protein
MSLERRRISAALAVIRLTLGQEYINERLHPARPDPFLDLDLANRNANFKFMDRVFGLGEMLFNMQGIEGFSSRVQRLRGEDLESALGELQGVQLLMRSGIRVNFVEPSGRKGHDFDVAAIIDDLPVACEMKTKVEVAARPSVTAIRASIEQARKQLPTDSPSVVFLKLPESWLDTVEGQSLALDGIREGMRQTRRINAVVAHWERWHKLPDGRAARVVMFEDLPNPNARQPLGGLQRAVKAGPESLHGNWREIDSIISSLI